MQQMAIFNNYLVTLLVDVEVGDEFNPINEQFFVRTGKFDQSDRGSWEICILKAGSQVYITSNPGSVHNNTYGITDSQNSHSIHADVKWEDTDAGQHYLKPQVFRPVPGKQGLWR